MKIGLDIHGVIDEHPDLFSGLSYLYFDLGYQVHIITGEKDSPELRDQLKGWNIKYTHFFSITSYHQNLGTHIEWKDKDSPWIPDEIWNETKAKYCLREGIDLHVDDSDIYGKYFKTPYCKF